MKSLRYERKLERTEHYGQQKNLLENLERPKNENIQACSALFL